MTPAAASTPRRTAAHAGPRPTAASASSCGGRPKAKPSCGPISPLCLMDRLARVLPDDVAVIEESPTTDGLLLRARRGLEEHQRLLCPARLGPGMGAELRDRREAGLARPPRAGDHRRRLGAVRHPGAMDRRPLPHPGHLRHHQQPAVQDPQGVRRGARAAGSPRPGASSAWTWWSRRSTTWAWPGRWAWRPGGSPSPTRWPRRSRPRFWPMRRN